MKKILLVGISALLIMALSIGVTVAYLTDRDTETNVFTWGEVEIDLSETFEQDSVLTPGVKIEKTPVITNTGDNDTWVWMTFSIPAALDYWAEGTQTGSSDNVIHWNPLGATAEGYVTEDRVQKAVDAGHLPAGTTAADILTNNKTWNIFDSIAAGDNAYKETIDGVEYHTYVLLYNKALQTNETTLPSIYQVYMDAQIDITPDGDLYRIVGGQVTAIDWNVNTDGQPKIIVNAYGIQTEGFANVQEAFAAYNAQWGVDVID